MSADRDPGGAGGQHGDTQTGEIVLARAVSAYQAALGSRLIAAYALGSLAHGGFSPLVSDVDLGLILDDPLRAKDGTTIRPDDTELLVAGAEFALGYLGGTGAGLPDRLRGWARLRRQDGSALDEIRAPSRLAARGPRRVTKIVLFPVRFLFTAETGRVGTNTLAAQHYLASDYAPAATLVTAALAWRREWPADDEATELLGRELIPLYVQYLDDHIARLQAVNCYRLVDGFQRWRARLLA